MTEWRIIPSFPSYEASRFGHIRRVNGYPLALTLEKNGYVKAHLWIDGKQHTLWAHRLVCEAFHGTAPTPGMDAAHENGVRHDNRDCNLGWKTGVENEFDKRAHGTANIGERNGGAVLTEAQVREIRRRAAELPRSSGGARIKKGALGRLAAEYGVTHSCLRNIVGVKQWRHVL